MADLVNFVMLVAAAAGSISLGVLAAYGILRIAFAIMRPQSQPSSVKARPSVARV